MFTAGVDGLPQGLRWSAMTPADLPAVLAVEQQAYSHPWTQRNLQDAMGAGNLAQLLWAGEAHDAQLVGYFVAMPGVDEVHLLNITVAPAWQGRSLARLMLGALGLWALQLNKPWVWLEVRRSNVRAIAVYERHGFQQVGVRKGYYPATRAGREDAIVMTLALARPEGDA
jgi:ribosomal-protein-alanine N-acetyltransferase